MEADEQRIASRKPVVLKVRFRASTVEEFAERYSRDLSEGGMFVRSPGPLPQPGTVLLLECRLSDGALLINGAASVAWVRAQPDEEGPSGFGMRFDDLSPESRAVLAMILETSAGSAAKAPPPLSSAPPLSAPPAPIGRATAPAGAARFPTLIGELPALAPQQPRRTMPEASPTPAAKPQRPAWFHSHEFDDEDDPPAQDTSEASAAANSASSAPPGGAPNVPSWFHSTALLQGTPGPPASLEPRPAVTSVPRSPTPPPPPEQQRPATPPPMASTPSPPERPRRTEPLSTPPLDPPRHLPRPTPAVVAAPHAVTPEPPTASHVPRARRHWMAVIVLAAATLAAFAIGYVVFEFVLGDDKSAEMLREIERHQANAEPPPVATPAPSATQEPPAAAPAAVPRLAPATETVPAPPTVVIPHVPSPAAAAPASVPPPAPRPVSTRRRPATAPATQPSAPPKNAEETPRRSKSGANTDFQKRLKELERMLKRK